MDTLTAPAWPGRRLVVVGNTGSGKTTLAAALAGWLSAPHVELDALHWGPNWQPAETAVFRQRVRQTLAEPAWVVDGNYSKVRDIVWSRAQALIWLDYSLAVVLVRLLRRSLRRVVRQETLWSGNQESWRGFFLSRESLLLWALKKQWSRRRLYRRLLADPAYAHLVIYRFRHPRHTDRWLANLNQ